jgi:tRNA A-37 threonylcarbamoyl transferase component Bud32
MSDLTGKTLGKYRIIARLGRGGMAEVYKAYQPGLDRYVAVKVMHSHLSDEEDFVGRFKREASAVANLRHPNIVQVYDFDIETELYYMVMEYIEGPTLKSELKERSIKGQIFSNKETARIFSALASAIDYAHGRGMVHRDLKPANIMFTKDGQVVLTDFGIARIMGATRYTVTGAISGTPAYMSPEQGQGERGDERSDIYSLGVILYEMVTGAVPFDADTPFAIIMKHINDPLPMPRALNPHIPEGVERVILKALSKNPDDRYQTASDMAAALRKEVGVTADQTLAAMPVTTIAAAPKLDEAPAAAHAAAPARPSAPAGATVAGQGAAQEPRKIAGLPLLPVAVIGGLLLVACVAAIAIIGTRQFTTAELKQQEQQRSIFATETALAATMAAQNLATPTPQPTLTSEPTYTPEPSPTFTEMPTWTPAPTSTERVVVVTPTSEPATDTPVPPPATDTPVPQPTTAPTEAVAEATDTPEPAASSSFSGHLAIPIDNGTGSYDVTIFGLPDGDVVGKITGARQPYFRNDGVVAVNGIGSGRDNIWTYNVDGSAAREISSSSGDAHPSWKQDGVGLVYDNPELVCAKSSCPEWHIFVQQGESKPESGVVASKYIIGGDVFRDQPMFPLWAADDYIIFRGCDIWQGGTGGGVCGIWRTPSWATADIGGFSVPMKLTSNDDIPTDTQGDQLIFMSAKDGNWEVYVTSITGGAPTNLSNNPAQDGLGTISPDGKWVAFASNRDGGWGIWAVPIGGGQAVRLPIEGLAWGGGDRDWTNERISWGP